MTASGLVANLVPLEYDCSEGPHGTLRGHLARANPVWRETLPQHEALAVFPGPQGYVSPGWYPSKREHGKVVPTWNYVAAQARGTLRVVDDAPWLRALVGRLTDRHESRSAQPWKVGDAPDDYVAQMLRAIVGVEIRLSALLVKLKLSQNRSAADRAGVVAGLEGTGDAEARALAGWMRRT
jgi:transcriptional regulator